MEVRCIQEGVYGGSSTVNGEQDGPNLNEFNPSWIEDGLGISGEQPDVSFDNQFQWDTTAWSRENAQEEEQPPHGDCTPTSPDTSKIYVKATHYVDGHWQCYWLDTTTCP